MRGMTWWCEAPRRRALLGLLALAGAVHMAPAPAVAQGPDEAAVLAVVTTLFDGMREKDEARLRSIFLPEARLGTGAVDGFIAQITSTEAYLDEVTFDEEVRIDGDLAMAWTPYNIFVNGEFQHCGVDVFVMRRVEGNWKILQLDDTRRTEGCDPERRG